MSDITRDALISVIESLEESREVTIKHGAKVKDDALIASILVVTENGANLKKLSREARATVKALVESAVPSDSPAKEPKSAKPEKVKVEKAEKVAKVEISKEEDSELPDVPIDENGESTDADTVDSSPIMLTSREALNTAAHDLNEVMGIEPGIDVSLPDDLFMRSFIKAAGFATIADKFTPQTWDVLAAHNLGPDRPTNKVKPEKVAKEKASKPAPPIKEPKSAKPEKVKVEKAEKVKVEKAEKVAKVKPEKAEKAKGTPRKSASGGLGVCASIHQYMRDHDGKSVLVGDVHAWLIKKFPEKQESSLLATLRSIVPGNKDTTRGYSLERVGKGEYKVHVSK